MNGLLFLGGSELQLPGIRAASALGFDTFVVDKDPNAPGRALSKRFFSVDAADYLGLHGLLKESGIESKISHIYCGSDFGLKTAAYLGEALGIDGITRLQAAQLLDKRLANKALADAGVRTPNVIQETRDVRVEINRVEYPVVVKPATGSGSIGVTVVNSESELRGALRLALESGAALIEEYVEGPHIDASGFLRHGNFFRGGLLRRFFTTGHVRVPTWGHQPALLSNSQESEIYGLLEEAARVLGLEETPVKADIVWTNGGPCVLEVSARFHGDVSSSFVCPIAYGVSPVEQWFAALAGREFDTSAFEPSRAQLTGWAAILAPRTGILSSITGLDRARQTPGVTDLVIRKHVGDPIASIDDNRAVVGFLFAQASTVEQLKLVFDQALASIALEMK